MQAWEAMSLIMHEHDRAIHEYERFNSPHEGFAVLLEEADELWDEVKKKKRDPERMRKEAVQVGAMAMRFLTDLL